METVQLTSDIWLLRFPVGQCYVVRTADGYALIDTGVPGAEEDILHALGRIGAEPGELREIVLTHCHVDHCGSAAALAAATGAAVLAGAADAPFIRGTAAPPPPVLSDWERPLYDSIAPTAPAVARPTPVDRELSDGDELRWGQPARVLHIPGHTPGSIAVHLPRHGVLFTGDAIAGHEGRALLGVFNADPEGAVVSMRRLAALEVETACFGHGPAIVGGAGQALREAAGL